MGHTFIEKAAELFREKRRRKRVQRTVAALAGVVVFTTTYMMILPAITMEADTICGLEEHTHGEACYELQLACGKEEGEEELVGGHSHGAACSGYVCGQTEHEAHTHGETCYGDVEVLSCGQTEHAAHTHGEACYEDEEVLSCGQKESAGHSHGESCYSETEELSCSEDHEHTGSCYTTRRVNTCGQSESAGHDHTGTCYTTQSKRVCGQSESAGHTHDESCYTSERQLLCTTAESEGHTHTDACIGLTCGQDECEPTAQPHQHSDACYEEVLICQIPEHTHTEDCLASKEPEEPEQPEFICGMEEHTHGEACVDENGEMICEIPEHTHDETCQPEEPAVPELPELPAYICGMEEHIHGEACVDENGEMICEIPEHTHDETCVEAVPVESTLLATIYTDATYAELEMDGTQITVTGILPEDIEIRAYPADVNVPGMQVLCAYDITMFLPDGTVYEPTEPVNVRFQLPEQDAPATLDMMEGEEEQPLEEELPEEPVDYTVYYLPEEGEPEAMETVTNEDGASFTAGHFSTYAMTRSISFTVEHLANLSQVDYSKSSGTLKVIDTSDAKLPQNGQTITPLYITLNDDGSVKTKTELVKVYADESYIYDEKLNAANSQEQNLANINKLTVNENYTLKTVRVSQNGGANWTDYDPASVLFTESASSEANVVQIQQGTKIQLIYDPKDNSRKLDANFYDYDITSRLNTTSNRYESGIAGINSRENYPTNNPNTNYDSEGNILAFGNQNCGTGMGAYLFAGGYLNGYNNNNSDYARDRYNNKQTGGAGCTFNLVKGLDSRGNIIWDDELITPNLFNDGDAIGKHTYSGSALQFSQSGDAHTLSSATVNGAGSVTRLDRFNNPVCGTTTYTNIWTNNFWPMDKVPASNRTDPLMGKISKDEDSQGTFQGFYNYAIKDAVDKDGSVNKAVNEKWSEGGVWNGCFPKSDDGQAHNCFFGLNFALNFDLSKDYIGPLDYLFFGDDDMWVFLTDSDGNSTLVCDIGGVHSSVGEYVNLWDYIQREGRTEDETYTLTFFYTERGASGSTCYMRFTLPSVSTATTTMDTGSVKISKTVESNLSSDMDKEFTFKLELPGTGSYIYVDQDGETGSVKNGDEITLKHNESITISGILAGRTVKVTEQGAEQYATIVGGVETKIGSATIKTDSEAEIAFINRAGTALPETGGPGTTWMLMVGTMFTLGAGALLIQNKRRKGAGRVA